MSAPGVVRLPMIPCERNSAHSYCSSEVFALHCAAFVAEAPEIVRLVETRWVNVLDIFFGP